MSRFDGKTSGDSDRNSNGPKEDFREVEPRYRSLFENMLDGAAYHRVVLDENDRPIDYIFLEVNSAFERQTGLKREDIIGKRVTEAIPGLEKSEFDWIETYGRVAVTGEETRFDQYSEPLERWYSVSAYSPAKDYFVAIFSDITERKRVEKELTEAHDELEERVAERTAELAKVNEDLRREIAERRRAEEAALESQETLRQIVDNSPAAIYLKDLEGRRILANHQYEMTFPPSNQAIVGKTDHEVFPKEFADVFRANDLKVIEGGFPLEFEEGRLLEDGLHTFISLKFPLRDGNGNISGVCGISTDITVRKKAEEALRRSEEHFRLMVTCSPDIMFSQDCELRYSWIFNPTPPFTADQVVGKTDYDLFPREEAENLIQIKKKILETGIGTRVEMAPTMGGVERRFDVAFEPQRDLEGRIIGLAGYARDITDHKRAEERLRQREREERTILDCLPAHAVFKDVSGVYITANQKWCEDVGCALDDLPGKTAYDVFPKDLADKYTTDDARVMAAGELLFVGEEE